MSQRELLTRAQQPALTVFAVGLLGLGVLALIHGDFALVWQPVAAWVPARTALAYASGALMLVCGVGLLFSATAELSIRIVLPYLVLWALLKVPALFVAPQMEAVWLGIGELTALLAGGWTLFARLTTPRERSWMSFAIGERGVRTARYVFAVSLLPIGLSHLVYGAETASFVPAWLPYRLGWAYLTGVGQIAAGLGVLFSVLPRVAATAEAAMLSTFTLLVWGPAILAKPGARLPWTGYFISWVIAGAAWVVATNVSRAVRVPDWLRHSLGARQASD